MTLESPVGPAIRSTERSGTTTPSSGRPSTGTVGRPAAPAPRPGRTLLGYLLVPRPKDLRKGLLVPAAFAIGAVATGGTSAHAVTRAVVVWAALELLIYAARYQWNDIRGFVADQQHPRERDRGRLPGPLHRARERVALSSAVAVARLAVVALLVVLLPGLDLGPPLVTLAAAVLGVAVVYEAVRTRATGWSSAMPPPLRPAVVGLWLVVGAGYAVRGVAGLALAVDLTGRPWLAAAAVVALWSFGVAFVTGRWALEALAFARARGRTLIWTALPGQHREHSLALVRWLPAELPAAPGGIDGWAALSGRTAPAAPWNVATLLTGAAAALTGGLLSDPTAGGRAAVAVLAGAAAAGGVVVAGRWRGPAVLAAAAALTAVFAALGVDDPLPAVLPWAALVGAYALCTRHSLGTLGRPLWRVAPLLRPLLVPVSRAALGPATWAAVARPPGRSGQ